MPTGKVHIPDVSLVVERGQPVHSLNRTRGQPALETLSQLVRIRRFLDPQNFDTEGLKPLRQRSSHTGLVRHDDHTVARTQRHTSCLTNGERRAQGGNRYATWDTIDGVETGENGTRSCSRV